jgi:alpha-soluble NSF attachment protein
MTDYEAKGRDWLSKGNAKLRSFGLFGNKYEEAAECFERAANQFKLAKSCTVLVYIHSCQKLFY